MNEEELAALEESNMPPLDEEETKEESAPSEVDTPTEQEIDPVQKKINKVVGQKHEALRRAEAAEAKLKELESKPQAQTIAEKPTLESFDFDEEAYQEALIDWKVEQKAEAIVTRQQQEVEQNRIKESKEQVRDEFGKKQQAYMAEHPDYADVVQNIPILPPETLETAMSKGPELIHYLGQHLDVAEKVAMATPLQAAVMLGEISAKMTDTKPEIKTSAASDPIETVSSGGSVAKNLEDMTMEDIWNL